MLATPTRFEESACVASQSSRSGTTLILNRETTRNGEPLAGTDYDASKDLARIPMTTTTLAAPVEALTWRLTALGPAMRQTEPGLEISLFWAFLSIPTGFVLLTYHMLVLMAVELPVVSIHRQIASALEYTHGEGICHFDIKPTNVLLTAAGRVKVNGVPVTRANQPGTSSDRVEVSDQPAAAAARRSPATDALGRIAPLKIVYEDDDVLVVDKGIVGWEASGRNGGGCTHYASALFHEEQRLWPLMDGLLGYPTEYRRERIIFASNMEDPRGRNFDLFTIRIPGNTSPGVELIDRFGSQSADAQGSNNLIGLKDPAIDALLEHVASATTRPQQVAALRALDRVLLWNEYCVPRYYNHETWIAYWNKFGIPKEQPRYAGVDTMSWWIIQAREEAIEEIIEEEQE